MKAITKYAAVVVLFALTTACNWPCNSGGFLGIIDIPPGPDEPMCAAPSGEVLKGKSPVTGLKRSEEPVPNDPEPAGPKGPAVR